MKPQFAPVGSLTNATQVGGVWETAQLSMTVMDREGVYLLSNVAVGDIVSIDSSAYEGGLVAPYRVTSIVSRSGTALVVFTITATSTFDAGKSDSATLTVQAAAFSQYPAASDVRAGVQYGASGEFTGTLAGGGGVGILIDGSLGVTIDGNLVVGGLIH